MSKKIQIATFSDNEINSEDSNSASNNSPSILSKESCKSQIIAPSFNLNDNSTNPINLSSSLSVNYSDDDDINSENSNNLINNLSLLDSLLLNLFSTASY